MRHRAMRTDTAGWTPPPPNHETIQSAGATPVRPWKRVESRSCPYNVAVYRIHRVWLMEAFYKHMVDLLASIDDCASKNRLLPCLTLLYSGIDVMASLDALPNEANQASFVRWVDRYLSINDCTPLDIYAARCGIVHTFAADSRLARDGKAKKIAYAWGTGKVEKLKLASLALGRQDWQCLHIGELVIAFR